MFEYLVKLSNIERTEAYKYNHERIGIFSGVLLYACGCLFNCSHCLTMDHLRDSFSVGVCM